MASCAPLYMAVMVRNRVEDVITLHSLWCQTWDFMISTAQGTVEMVWLHTVSSQLTPLFLTLPLIPRGLGALAAGDDLLWGEHYVEGMLALAEPVAAHCITIRSALHSRQGVVLCYVVGLRGSAARAGLPKKARACLPQRLRGLTARVVVRLLHAADRGRAMARVLFAQSRALRAVVAAKA